MRRLRGIDLKAIAGPLLTGCTGGLMLVFIDAGSTTGLVVDENSLGPLSWPRVMILGIIVTSLIWGIARTKSSGRTGMADTAPASIDRLRLGIGIVAIVGYGTAIVYIGFAFATFLFLLCWLWLGNFRKPLPLLSCSLIGTLAVLYLFLKVAYLPMPKGMGWMETVTVALYQFLGIF